MTPTLRSRTMQSSAAVRTGTRVEKVNSVLRDFLMTPSWRLLGPLETANGTLLFGVSTAMIFGVMLWLIQARFTDLKD